MKQEEKKFTLGKDERLRREKDFSRVIESGRRFSHRALTLLALPNGMDKSRFGIAVSRKLGKATVRNRAKRRMREALRLSKHILGGGYDVVAMPRSPVLEMEFTELLETVASLFRKIKREQPQCEGS